MVVLLVSLVPVVRLAVDVGTFGQGAKSTTVADSTKVCLVLLDGVAVVVRKSSMNC
jgi:hypothetical protein